ncbi:HD-GYP domain-containing protein [Candidatus Symbiobacter mobilis]|uniref:HD-GYP domain-containing protein n=1 Tax=Candidatus Symbiobacter mobilis TaxID=1436290 RepID=UPI000688B21A|nr:HD domain-containing phosphohydrolase [Candidatus Symbiobacter mobilis]
MDPYSIVGVVLHSEDEYEDLLALWSDLEAGLGVVLTHPSQVQEFVQRIAQYDQWMRDLLQRDADVGLYLLFQLATHSPVGYSTSHALVCAVLCHLVSQEFALPSEQRDGLVYAAMTMNIAMTTLQDQLATQGSRPTPEQQQSISVHASQGAMLLARLGIDDNLWLRIVELHHNESPSSAPVRSAPTEETLARILRVIDRYAAMISPRRSREGRSAEESAKYLLEQTRQSGSDVEQALVRIVGLYPPGTFVRLDNGSTAIVTRRSASLNQPDVVIVLQEGGGLLKPPLMHPTSKGSPKIQAALPSSAVQERLSHHRILQLVAPG